MRLNQQLKRYSEKYRGYDKPLSRGAGIGTSNARDSVSWYCFDRYEVQFTRDDIPKLLTIISWLEDKPTP